MQSLCSSLRLSHRYSLKLVSNASRMVSSSSISAAIKNDHAEINDAYEMYVSAEGNVAEEQRWANQFRWELARQRTGKELVLYPAFEKHLGSEGKRMADQDRAHYQDVTTLLHLLETSLVTDSQYRSTFDKLMKNLKEYIKGEEENDLPKFEKAISSEQSAAFARTFERTKVFVPTRAHPNAQHRPPFETVAGLMAAPIDKLRDLFEKYPDTK